jgi:hypothetical protein
MREAASVGGELRKGKCNARRRTKAIPAGDGSPK